MEEIGTNRTTEYSSSTLSMLIALAYSVLGALGLMLAIPPGYASPVFPASGLALASVLWFGRRTLPAVWLGSLVLNLSQTLQHGTLTPTTMIVALVIACGAFIQAWIGYMLVTRWLGQKWRNLEYEQNAFNFMLLGGVLACLSSASISVAGLYVAGVIERPEVLFTWWNWYVGDTLGVLVFGPMTIYLLNSSNRILIEQRRHIIIPMLLILSLVMLAFYGAARWEKKTQSIQLQTDGKAIAKRIDDRLIAHHEVLTSLHNFTETLQDFSFTQFENFTKVTLQNNPDIFALSFNDLITHEQRPAFENLMGTLSPLGVYQITERDSQKRLIRAAIRAEYVPVRYIVPLTSNKPAVGFDINSEPIRRDAIKRARASGSIAVTSPIQLVQEQKNRVGVLEIIPVQAKTTANSGGRDSRLLGFAVSVVKVDELINIATRDHFAEGLVFQVSDPLAPKGKGLLYCSDADGFVKAASTLANNWKTSLRMGDRTWELSVFTTKAYWQSNRPWMAWAVGVVGLLFAAILQLLMLGMAGRASEVLRKNEAQKAREIAESASHTKSEFLATMSHEIRTPLNAILGMTDLLAETSLDSVQAEYIAVTRTAGENLQTLINDVLDLSKIEAGKLHLDIASFKLRDSINQVIAMLSVRADQKKLSLELSLDNGVPDWLSGDSFRLLQILLNLVGNAIKFTEQGKVSLKVEPLSTDGGEAVLKFTITDTGIGIPSDKLHTIFDHFTQADSSTTRNYGGSGLGLTVSRKLVEMMGGELSVESTPGVGSCFYFTCRFVIPLDIPEEVPPVDWEKQPARNLTILLVDDNKDNRTVISAYFRKTEHKVETALNGEEAVTRTKQGCYDLVLMDMEMPVMDGYTAVRLIRDWELETGRTPLPIIALTANALKEDHRRSLEAGCTDHLTKPIRKEKLLEVVSKYAGNYGE